jgi:hypothetical protein
LAARIKQVDADGDGYLSVDDIITSLQRDVRERRILKWCAPCRGPRSAALPPGPAHATNIHRPASLGASSLDDRMAVLLVVGFLVVCGAMAGVTYGIVVRSKEVKSGDYGGYGRALSKRSGTAGLLLVWPSCAGWISG